MYVQVFTSENDMRKKENLMNKKTYRISLDDIERAKRILELVRLNELYLNTNGRA